MTRKSYFICILFSGMIFLSSFYNAENPSDSIPVDRKWSERMALSFMKRNQDPWQKDSKGEPKWEYTHGLVMKSIERLAESKKDEKFIRYVLQYADYFVTNDGEIKGYDIDEFNIDNITPGRILFKAYDQTKEKKYLTALQKLRKQLQWQPRTTEGGFWHKLRYPWQMWLDGLYMGSPFYAEYAMRFNEPGSFDDVARQFILMEKNALDTKTGLLYHGWDESRVQKWANPETGQSPNFWGRAMGWYAMALVDVLDYIPQNHQKRKELLAILYRLVAAIEKYQDQKSGVWYQVLDQANKEGNYLESSASCMFVYAIAKAVNKGYIDKNHQKAAAKGYEGILKNFIEVTEDGEVNITKGCSVAGLGGNPYRDGSYQYYLSEKVITNDAKAEGPFILASLELGK